MALVPITHVYDTLSVINNTGLLDGQILYTTDQTVNKIFADVKVNNILRRIEIGGTNTIDTVLDQDSGHAIANSAVAKLAQTVHTNLINPTLGTTTINGVTCTKNSEGTYTLTGTATSDSLFVIRTAIDTLELPKTYRLVGCPSGGGGSTFELNTVKIVGTSRSVFATDRGNGATIEYVSGATYEVQIRIANNAVLDNVTFKPMLTTDLSATYDDFVQYSGDGELNENVADLYNNLNTTNSNLTALNTKVGAQSLLPTPSQSVTQNINTLNSNLSDLTSWTQLTNEDLNNYKESTHLYATGTDTVTHKPGVTGFYNWMCEVVKIGATARVKQTISSVNLEEVWYRFFDGTDWQAWHQM